MKVFVYIQTLWCHSSLWPVVPFLLQNTSKHQLTFFFFVKLSAFWEFPCHTCVLTLHGAAVCRPWSLWTVSSLFLAGSEHRQLASKTAFGRTPRALWEVGAQRGSLSPHRGIGCEKITGSDNKCLYQKLQAAPERIFSAVRLQISAESISSAPLLQLSQR